jgi:hypothetical protein
MTTLETNMRYLLPGTLATTAAFLLACPPVSAQVAQRSAIVGAVADANGDPVAGATLTLEGPRVLGGARTTVAAPDGRYRFTELLPGVYHVRASAPGFTPAERRDLPLPVETTWDVNFTLAVPDIAERVEVPGRAPLIDARTSATPAVFGAAVLHDVPTARTLQSVLALVPGVTTTPPLYGVRGEVAFGGTQGSNGVRVDNVPLTEGSLGTQWTDVSYNWLEEVQVVALGAAAEYGGFTGAIANGVLRSGSNRVAGLGEYLVIRPAWTAQNLRNYPKTISEPVAPRTIEEWWDLNAQVGAPVVRDRAWVFGGLTRVKHVYRNWGYAGPTPTDHEATRSIVKADAAALPGVHVQGFVTRDVSDVLGADLSRGRPTPESSADRFRRNTAWNARATWTPSGRTVIEGRVSGNEGGDRSEPRAPATYDGPPIQRDWGTGITCCNVHNGWSERRTALATATLGHYRDGLLGTHDLRGGVEIEASDERSVSRIPTGRAYTYYNGVLAQIEEWAGDDDAATSQRVSLYVQDRWTVNSRLTVEPGLRIERYTGAVPGRPGSFATTPIAPRLGAAWDVTGRQTTVARAHYGRYHDMLFSNIYSNLFGVRSPHVFYDVIDGVEVEAFRYRDQAFGEMAASLDQSHVDQFVAGVEQAIGGRATVQVQYIGRRFGNFIGYIDRRLAEFTRHEFPDPGPDGQFGTSDDGGMLATYRPYGTRMSSEDRDLVLGNPANAYRRYDGLQLIGTRRFDGLWQAQVSYTWSRSRGTVGNEYHTNATYWSLSPLGSVGADLNRIAAGEGRPRFDYSEFKALGSFRAPWLTGFTVSGVYRWHTGTRWERQASSGPPFWYSAAAEPLGSRRTPNLHNLDLRVEKTFRLRTFVVGAYADFFNVTNLGRATLVHSGSGPYFGLPWGWTDPRTGRLGFRVNF